MEDYMKYKLGMVWGKKENKNVPQVVPPSQGPNPFMTDWGGKQRHSCGWMNQTFNILVRNYGLCLPGWGGFKSNYPWWYDGSLAHSAWVVCTSVNPLCPFKNCHPLWDFVGLWWNSWQKRLRKCFTEAEKFRSGYSTPESLKTIFLIFML